LRHPAEVARSGIKISSALVIRPEELSTRLQEIPRDHEIILYCTCPNESTSARLAMQLKQAGLTRVRPLTGGFDAWHGSGFPTEAAGQTMEDHVNTAR
jgi:rhodanese-related sulfurtransferase